MSERTYRVVKSGSDETDFGYSWRMAVPAGESLHHDPVYFQVPQGCMIESGDDVEGTSDNAVRTLFGGYLDYVTMREVLPDLFAYDKLRDTLLDVSSQLCVSCEVRMFCRAVKNGHD
ncbi:MAG: hypothetical protein TR69_WS6001001496 [candidate division WS6 bacterium OLB20]|uniref:Uncharacterized protein n=1 Tax=candidate division WS6 bacterium OLB20 TaxID=1617426 RepID=A0A136LW51_9BACT|nr:MAG: hypothetical protein TR69_WS6001001496 [candidate division WS6 bacterium OLB20]